MWSYQTTHQAAISETPYSLTYGSESIIPAEISVPTPKILNFNPADNEEELCLSLDLVRERQELMAIKEA